MDGWPIVLIGENALLECRPVLRRFRFLLCRRLRSRRVYFPYGRQFCLLPGWIPAVFGLMKSWIVLVTSQSEEKDLGWGMVTNAEMELRLPGCCPGPGVQGAVLLGLRPRRHFPAS